MVPKKHIGRANATRTLEETHDLAQICFRFLSRKNGNVAYSELIALAERTGFIFERQKGSHEVYKHPTYTMGPAYYDMLIFQNVKGKAVFYQIKQLVDFIRQAIPKARSK